MICHSKGGKSTLEADQHTFGTPALYAVSLARALSAHFPPQAGAARALVDLRSLLEGHLGLKDTLGTQAPTLWKRLHAAAATSAGSSLSLVWTHLFSSGFDAPLLMERLSADGS